MINKIAYVVYTNESYGSGVFKKIITSINTWGDFGINSRLYVLTSNINLKKQIKRSFIKNIEVFYFNSIISKITSYNKLISNIIKFSPDLVYYRYHMFIPGYSKISSKFPVIIEVNTNDVEEKKLSSKISYLYNKITRNFILNNCNGIIYVTPEMPYLKEFSKFKKQYLVLGNSINLDSIQMLKPTNNKIPNLVYIGGSNQMWQGIDKIILLAKLFPDWIIHVIGFHNLYDDIPPNIKFYGFLSFDSYKKIMSKADCAIGTLALHRKNMNYASPLKVLEYLALGLPIIIAYKDTNLPVNSEFILELPNIENNISPNKEKIKKFVYKWLNKRINRKDIEMIDTKNIEKKRIEFFVELINKS